jgi:hypothetical protein
MKDRLEEFWDHLSNPYWRADHPEVAAAIVSLITGCVGLLFAWLQYKILNHGGEQK